jgi:type IV pilus biogenesis protein CpaD/CtpE
MAPAAALLVALPALHGCALTPRFDQNFGLATRANLRAQVIDPGAGANPNPAAGIDGSAARAAHERYQRSFREPATGEQRTLIGTGDRR